MKIKECAFLRTGNDTCNLFPELKPLFHFVECEAIPISKCPYKEFQLGIIDKLELNNKIKKILDKGN